ncbi:MAG TPA: hypothetical protein VGQ36_27900 [Thermoanaerobaculia bacterium]|jgi:hypothetical protein|nr:hypothetical protein [Thermoanaerobaculia bacterium]
MNGNKDSLIVFKEALKAAEKAASRSTTGSDETPDPTSARELTILFYGIMCFDPLPTGSGYRVLFPNGLDVTELTDIPVHAAGMWVRNRSAKATVRWSGPALRNDFFVTEKRQLTITGLVQTPLNTSAFEGYVTNLQDCDPQFKISNDPDAVLTMNVDRGTLSAHVANDAGMIVVRWTVQVEDGAPVRFAFGSDFVEIPPTVTQVFLANASPISGAEGIRDFQLFRKLSMSLQTPLPYRLPRTMPKDRITLPDPTFGFTTTAPADDVGTLVPEERTTPGGFPSIVGDVDVLASELDVVAQTPIIVCSPVASRLRDTA